MIEFLAAIGFIVLYFIWLFSPIIMTFCIDNDNNTIGSLACTVYIGGAFAIFCILVKFVGIW